MNDWFGAENRAAFRPLFLPEVSHGFGFSLPFLSVVVSYPLASRQSLDFYSHLISVMP